MKYFAYGSNLCTNRLRERVPSAQVHAAATLKQHSLRFNKRSLDGSGKCNAFFTGHPKDETLGVVFEIDTAEKPMLDHAEGTGYYEKPVEVLSRDANIIRAFTYIAKDGYVDDSLSPYNWYKNFVVHGARQHGFPGDYIQMLEVVNSRVDPDQERTSRNRRLLSC